MAGQVQGNTGSDLYALLIGIDCYLDNALPDGSYYGSLRGCVRDVQRVEAFLLRKLGIPQENILKLTASNTGAVEPSEPLEQWPTYENMVTTFKRIGDMAQPGDHIYVHYSGHGGRACTNWPELKGGSGIDEALVPTDIGNSKARYLRDLELARLLTGLVDKALNVAVVLDSCHSGGMTRGRGDVGIRGIGTIDATERPKESLVGTHEELAELWDHLTERSTRSVALGSGWLPEPKGYVLLAACRPNEFAYECAFDGKEWNGALTYWLLDSLEDCGPGLSYKVLHDRIVGQVHSQFEKQTPQLQGEGDRAVFGSECVEPHYAVLVLDVDAAGNRVTLNAGQAHGIRKGAQFAIFPHGTVDFSDREKRRAVVELSDLGATQSRATILEEFGKGAIEEGAQAVLLGTGSAKLVHKVYLERQEDLDPSIDQDTALLAVKGALEGNGWVEVAANGEEIEYHVAVNEKREYEVWDRTGQVIKNLRPMLAIDDTSAAADVARRLTHLSKYHAIQQLRNHDHLSPLARKLVVELVGKQEEYDPADPFEPQPFNEPGGTPIVKVREWVGLRIKNESSQAVNVTVFDLRPDWSAAQIYPSGEGDYFVEFDPGQELVIPLCAYLPPGYEEGADVIKVFATVGTTNFRWMQLPTLDKPLARSVELCTESVANALEEMMSAFTADQPPTRNLIPAAYPSKEWITAQVELRMQEA